jgi:hypothetical protein
MPTIVFVIVLIVLIPVGFLMSTAVAAAIIGALLGQEGERRNADSELIATNT